MKPSAARLTAAFAVIYLVWGSTYLGIRIALQAWPPFLLAGTRFVVAGLVLLALARRAGSRLPRRAEWAGCAVTGAFMFLLGNGLLCWAEQEVASGVAALAIATVPVWMSLIPAPGVAGRRSSGPMAWSGVALGLVAIAVLALPGAVPTPAIAIAPLLALLGSAACWATGSHLTLRLPHPPGTLMSAGAQMLCGGLSATAFGSLRGEWGALEIGSLGATGLAAWAYLVLFGSVLALSAYLWLLRNTSPSAVGTYAFVNPVVAVLLGSALAWEALGPRTLLSLALVVASVVLVLAGRREPRAAPRPQRLRAVAALLLVTLFAPASARAGVGACAGHQARPSCCWPARERAAARAPASAEDLLALVDTAWDPNEDWRVRLTALASAWRSERGRALLAVLESLRGELVIETPRHVLVLRLATPECTVVAL